MKRLSVLPSLCLCWLAACDDGRGTLTITGTDSADGATGDPSTNGGSDTPEKPTCANAIVGSQPSDDAVDVALGDPITVTLASPEPGASLRVRDGSRDVPGDTVVDGAELTFLPSVVVRADTDHTTVLSWSCDDAVISWRTISRVQQISLEGARLTAPGTELALEDAFRPWIVRLDALGPRRLELLVAPGSSAGISPCEPTELLKGSTEASGRFEVSQPRATLGLEGGASVRVDDLVIRGELGASEALQPLSVRFTVDVGQLAAIVLDDTDSTASDVCARVDGGCVPCRSGTSCIEIVLDGAPVSTLTRPGPFGPRSAADIAADPTCR